MLMNLLVMVMFGLFIIYFFFSFNEDDICLQAVLFTAVVIGHTHSVTNNDVTFRNILPRSAYGCRTS